MDEKTENFIKVLLDPAREKWVVNKLADDTFNISVPNIDQNNQSHCHTLLEHCLAVVDNLPRNLDPVLYLAGYLHDIGKPDCMTTDEITGFAHFYKHPARSAEIIRENWKSMGLNDVELNDLIFYVEFHDVMMNKRMHPIRSLIRKGADWRMFCNLMRLQIADASDHKFTEHTVNRITNAVWSMSDAGKVLFDAVWDEEKGGN